MNYRTVAKVVKQSLKDTIAGSFWKWFVGSIGALLGVFGLGKNFFGLSVLESVIWGGLILAALFILRLVFFGAKNSLKHFHEVYKNSIYGDAIIILKESFAQAHAYRKSLGYREEEFIAIMLIFCNNLKTIYDKITRGNCCVSIKIPLQDIAVHEKTVLKNLTRDVKHKSSDSDEYKGTKHTLIGNTAFSYTLGKVLEKSKEKYYINNDVKGSENYLNTSKNSVPDGILQYESELVHPIIPIISHNNKDFDCVGFICIDCDKKNAFIDTKYQIAIIEGVADGLYDIISQVNQNKEHGT